MATVIVKISNLCRTCTKNCAKEELIPLYPSGAINDIKRYENDDLQFSEDDGLPQQICGECLDQFNDMNEFLQRCVNAQANLQKKFKIASKFVLNTDKLTELSGKIIKNNGTNENLKIQNVSILSNETENDNTDDFENKDAFDYEEFLSDDLSYEPDSKINNNEISNKLKVEILHEAIVKSEPVESLAIDDDFDVEIELEKAIKAAQEVIKNEGKNPDNVMDEDSAKYDCDICSETDMTQFQYKEHRKYVHSKSGSLKKKIPESRLKKTCEICGQAVRGYLLQIHINNHLGIENKKYKCEVCLKEYLTMDSLRSHRYKHKQKLNYCTSCRKGFRNKTNLKLHNEEYPDGSCYDLKKKQNTTASKATLKCLYCMKKFINAVSLVSHCKTHKKPGVNDPKHICKYCNSTFKRADHLKIHINSQHLKTNEFKCEYCGKILYASFRLNRHIKSKHLQVAERPRCDHCDKTFASTGCLKRHKLDTHNTEKGFSCPICIQSFYKHSELLQHSKVHDSLITNDIEREIIVKEFCPDVNVDSTKKSKKAKKERIVEEIVDFQIFDIPGVDDVVENDVVIE